MEVLLGPTFAIDGNHATAYDKIQTESAAHVKDVAQDKAAGGGDLFLEDGQNRPEEDSPESSSSIGAPDDSSEEEEEEEEEDVVSSDGGLGSLSALQDCLPIKRGLSNHYKGRSKSFLNLSEAKGVKDLEKVENPFNKRQRILMANKWSRKSKSSCQSPSFYSWRNPKSMPLLRLQEEDEDGNVPHCNNVDEDEDDDVCRPSSTSFSSSSSSSSLWSSPMLPKLNFQSRKLVKADLTSRSCFSLTDLQEEN